MIFDFSKFVIEVDLDKTKKFYDKSTVSPYDCSCHKCRNYMLAIDDFPQEVFDFFGKLGVDVRKSPEVHVVGELRNGKFCYGGFYHLCGNIISPDRMGPNDSYSITNGYEIWFSNDISLLERNFPTPAIQMEINFHVPWKLNKDIK